jgi:hypothetical protein
MGRDGLNGGAWAVACDGWDVCCGRTCRLGKISKKAKENARLGCTGLWKVIPGGQRMCLMALL